MDKAAEDKTVSQPDAAPASTGTAATPSSQLKPEPSGEKSWGDKYKSKAFYFIRNDLVNYGVNFSGSALFTYALTKKNDVTGQSISPMGKRFDRIIQSFANAAEEKVGIPQAVGKHIGSFFTVTQLLLCGGHALLPFMKWSHDNRKLLEFGIGHRLDQLQQVLGQGNATTRRNLQEYKYIKDLLSVKPKQLTDEDKTMLAKHGIDEHLNFSERRSSWKHVLTARAAGVAATTTLGIGLALSKTAGKDHWANYETHEKNIGEFIGKNVVKKIPKLGAKVESPNYLGKVILMEMIYTLVSKLGFDHVEHNILKKQEAEEAALKANSLEHDRIKLAQHSSHQSASVKVASASDDPSSHTSPALEARRKIIEGGEKDFRAREAAKPNETSLALS